MKIFISRGRRLLHNLRSRVWATVGRKGWANGAWGVVDYLTQPLLMLLLTPLLLHRLGPSQFGIWMFASATVSGGSLLASGFGDAAVNSIAQSRARNDRKGVIRTVQCMLTINLTLSGILAVALWSGATYVVPHMRIGTTLQPICIAALRFSGCIFMVKSVESVFISTLRGFEMYGTAVHLAIVVRIAVMAGIVALVAMGGGIIGVMWITLCAAVIGSVFQAIAVSTIGDDIALVPSLHWATLKRLSGFGSFSWLQALASISFSQVDRLIVGILLGAPTLAYYSICTQIAQPIHGLLASGFHFLFPRMSGQYSTAAICSLQKTVSSAFWINQLLVLILSVSLMQGGHFILTVWMGGEFVQHVWPILGIITLSYSMLGMNVTAYYALLATGGVKQASHLNSAAGIAMLTAMGLLVPRLGIQGAAIGRLFYGPITWLMYLFVYKKIWQDASKTADVQPRLGIEGSAG